VAVLALVALVFALPAAQVRGQPSPSSDPGSVVAAFELARNRGDVDAALAFFANDATIRQRTTVFTGRDEIRRFLEGLTSRGRYPAISNRRIEGSRVLWGERTAGTNQNLPETSVEAVVVEGKIRSIVYQGGPITARVQAAVDTRGQLPALFGTASVAMLLLGSVLVASTRFNRRRRIASSLQGQLMDDLRGWHTARLKA
jgi:hypothetical protein